VTARAHRRQADADAAARGLSAWLVTASDSRTAADDRSGDLLAAGLAAAGVGLRGRRIVNDEPAALRAALREALASGVDAVVVTGGTGIAPRDVTPEAVLDLGGRELPGFGELFRALSFAEVGTAAYLSRALAVVRGRQVIFALPGSPAACRLALERLILPELSHLVAQASRDPSPNPRYP
jgi:molybdenum cofactor biosynthesis protein B